MALADSFVAADLSERATLVRTDTAVADELSRRRLSDKPGGAICLCQLRAAYRNRGGRGQHGTRR